MKETVLHYTSTVRDLCDFASSTQQIFPMQQSIKLNSAIICFDSLSLSTLQEILFLKKMVLKHSLLTVTPNN